MSGFFKFKILITLKLNFNGVNLINKYPKLVIPKSEKSHTKIVMLEAENFEHLCCRV